MSNRKTALALGGAALVATVATGCGPSEIDQAIEAWIGGERYPITAASNIVRQEQGETRVFLTARSEETCDVPDDETSFTADIRVPNVASVPLGTPIDVAGSPPFHIETNAGHADCSYSLGLSRTVSGSVTFTGLSTSSAAGDIDLRIDGAANECGEPPPISIRFSWRSFVAPFREDDCD